MFSRRKFQKTNIGFLSILLAIVDFIGLSWNFIVYKYLPLIHLNLALVHPFTCFTFKYISRIFQQLPLYTQAFITLVNFLKVKHPRKFLYLNKNINIIYIMIVIFLSEGLVNSGNLFQYITYINGTASSCGTSSNTMAIVANFTTSLLRSIIPAVFMTILDFLTIKILFVSKRRISNDLSKQKAFAIVLLILDIIFFIFNVPLSLTEILTAVFQNILLYPSSNNTMALEHLLHAFANTFAYIYYIMPFFINLFFNRLFRQELYAFLFRTRNSNASILDRTMIRTTNNNQ